MLDTDKYARFSVLSLARRQQVADFRLNALRAAAAAAPSLPLVALPDVPPQLTTVTLLRARAAADARFQALLGAISRLAMPALDLVSYSAAAGSYRMAILYPGGLKVFGLAGVGRPVRSRSPRGRIVRKSERSRRRQMEFLMRIRPAGVVQFVTLTVSDAHVRVSLERGGLSGLHADFARAMELMGKRFERRFRLGSASWNKEIQDRKSGDFIGTLVPHAHLLAFQCEADGEADRHLLPGEQARSGKTEAALRLQAWFKSAWSEVWAHITGVSDAEHERRGADVVELSTRKAIVNYVSKYMGKSQGVVVDAEGSIVTTGRWWGYWGKANLPLHPGIVLHLSDNEVVNLRRLVKRWLKARGRAQRAGRASRSALDFARRLCCQRVCDGFVVFGLGIELLGARASPFYFPALGVFQYMNYARLADDAERRVEAEALWRLYEAIA